jgi:hypothetical protein
MVYSSNEFLYNFCNRQNCIGEILGIEISNIIPSQRGGDLFVESYGITTDEVAKLLPDLSSNQLLAVQSFIRSISHLK